MRTDPASSPGEVRNDVEQAEVRPKGDRDEVAASAGRGVLFIGAAKIYFLMAGAAIEFALARVLGADRYGSYRFVNSVVSPVNNVMVTGTIQAVSRDTTADLSKAEQVKATGLRMHLFIGLPLAVIFGLGAPLWAHLAHDAAKTKLLAMSAVIALSYAFYAVLVGAANGARQFHKQAGLDMTFATMRAIAVVGGAAGLGVVGAIGGWIVASVIIFGLAAIWVGLPKSKPTDVRPMARYLAGVATYLILVNLLMTVDSFLLKRLSAEWLTSHGVTDEHVVSDYSDGRVGYYGAVQLIARLPYQLMLAVTFVIFPLVSQATFSDQKERAQSYVRTTLRYSLIFASAMAVAMAALPDRLLRVPFLPEYGFFGGQALATLAIGHVGFAIFAIAGTILNSAGYTREPVLVAAVTLLALVVGLWVAIPQFSNTEDVLMACGAATGGAMIIGAILSVAVLWRRMGAGLPPMTVVRVAVALAVGIAAGRFLPARGKIVTLAEAIVVVIVFLIALVVTGELKSADVKTLLGGLLRRRKPA
jgi:stage V sporulation protein B